MSDDQEKREKLLPVTLSALIERMFEEGHKKYEEQLREIICEMAELSFGPLKSQITNILSFLKRTEQKAVAEGNPHLYTLAFTLRLTYQSLGRFVEVLKWERASRWRDEIIYFIILTKILTQAMAEHTGKTFQELKGQIEELKKQRLKTLLEVPKNVESELKEWMQERERMKRAIKQYIT